MQSYKYSKFFDKNRRKKVMDKHNENLYVPVKVYIPVKTYEAIAEVAVEKQMPVSRVIAYGIDNELGSEDPFSFELEFDMNRKRVKNEFAHEASLMFHYIKKYESGISLDQLVLCRRDMSIEDKERVIGAYIELLDADMIEEVKPSSKVFKYPDDYVVAKIPKQLLEGVKK